MNAKKIVLFLFVILSFSLCVSAQDDYYDQERDRLEAERRQQEINKKFEQLNGTASFDLSYFLPKTQNAWFVSITTTGGFIGGTRLVAAVNSEGNYLCSADQDFTNQLIENDVFRPLFQTINGFDFKKYNINKVKEFEGCKDCAYTTLTFQSANKTYSYSRNTFATAEDGIKEIYDKVMDSPTCR